MKLRIELLTFITLLTTVSPPLLLNFLAAPVLAQTQNARKAEWVRVKTNRNGSIFSVDVASIEKRGRFRYFWSNVIAETPRSVAGQRVYTTNYYLSVDCQKKLYRLHFMQMLDENFKTIRERDYGKSFALTAPPPGSSEEASMKFVCSRRR